MLWSLLVLASIQTHAEETTARVIYNNESKRPIAIIVNTKDQSKREKCESLIMSKEGQEILKKQAENINKRIIELKFTCNL